MTALAMSFELFGRCRNPHQVGEVTCTLPTSTWISGRWEPRGQLTRDVRLSQRPRHKGQVTAEYGCVREMSVFETRRLPPPQPVAPTSSPRLISEQSLGNGSPVHWAVSPPSPWGSRLPQHGCLSSSPTLVSQFGILE